MAIISSGEKDVLGRVKFKNPETGCSPSSTHCNLARGLASAIYSMRCAKGGAGTGNPAREATRTPRFPGCRRACPDLRVKGDGACLWHVTSSGGSRAQRAGVRDCFASVLSLPRNRPDADRRYQWTTLSLSQRNAAWLSGRLPVPAMRRWRHCGEPMMLSQSSFSEPAKGVT